MTQICSDKVRLSLSFSSRFPDTSLLFALEQAEWTVLSASQLRGDQGLHARPPHTQDTWGWPS